MKASSGPEPGCVLGLEIGGISLALKTFQPWKEDEAFRPFAAETKVPDFQAEFLLTDVLPPIPAQVLHRAECYRVHPDGRGGYLRSFHDAPRDDTPYALGEYDWEKGEIRIHCLAAGRHCVSDLHNSFFHIGFEGMLISRQRLCLHASCVETGLGGILFTGPSGIGKSTQADLWCVHRGAKQINGDRPILSKDVSGWLAWGSPYAGSSGCHINENCPVRAIVSLQWGKECSIRRLNPPEAFRAVWAGLTVPGWDRRFVERAADLTLELIGSVPVYSLTCTPDEKAVRCLEEELGKEFQPCQTRQCRPGL